MITAATITPIGSVRGGFGLGGAAWGAGFAAGVMLGAGAVSLAAGASATGVFSAAGACATGASVTACPVEGGCVCTVGAGGGTTSITGPEAGGVGTAVSVLDVGAVCGFIYLLFYHFTGYTARPSF